jgi:hypothetical protein
MICPAQFPQQISFFGTSFREQNIYENIGDIGYIAGGNFHNYSCLLGELDSHMHRAMLPCLLLRLQFQLFR